MRHGASSRHMGEPRPAAGVEPGLLAASLAMALLLMAFGALATLGGALLLFIPGHIWDFAGIGLFIIVYCLQRYYCPAGFRQTA